tara:strand:- start:585 stop:3077 length:2493 start_codon:yes stop_codon:yes gene_type:complete
MANGQELRQLQASIISAIESGFKRASASKEGLNVDMTGEFDLEKARVDATYLADAMQQVNALSQQINDKLYNRVGVSQEQLAITQKEVDNAREALAQELKKLNLHENGVRLSKEDLAAAKQSISLEKERLINAERRLSVEQAIVGAQTQAVGTADSLLRRFTGITDHSQKFLGNILTASTQGGRGMAALTQSMAAFGNTITSRVLNPANMLGSILDKVVLSTVKMVNEYSNVISRFQQSTGLVGMYNKEIERIFRNNSQAAITMGQVAGSLTGLLNNFRSFGLLARTARVELIEFNAVLAKLGVSTQQAAKAQDFLMGSLGNTVGQTKMYLLELRSLAEQLGMPAGALVDEFNRAMPVLIRYGQSARNMFSQLARQAQSLRVSVGDLMQIASRYDTFDTAARHVGRLNALLGGPYLNSVRMLNAAEGQRVETIIQSVKASGMQFNQLNKHLQIAIQQAAGVRDLDTAQRIFNMTTRQYIAYKKTQADTEEMARRKAAQTASITEKLTSIFNQYGQEIVRITNATGRFLGYILELNDKIIKSTGAMFNLGNVMLTLAGTMYMGRLIFAVRNITGLFGGLIGRSTAAGGALGNLSNTSAGTARGLGGTARAGGALNQTLTRMPGPVLRATSAIGGLAIEIAAISAGVGVAAFGIGKLVSAIRGVPDEININGQDIAQLAMAVNALEERKVGLVSQLSNNLAGLQGSINNLQVGPLREMSGLLAQFSAIGGINFNFNADNIAKLQGVITELKSLDPDKPAAMAAMFGQAARKAQVESKLVRYGDAQGGVQITNLAIPPIQIEATLNGQRVASILAEEITPVIAARVAHALRTR